MVLFGIMTLYMLIIPLKGKCGYPGRSVGALWVVDCARCLCAVRVVRSRGIHRNSIHLLGTSIYLNQVSMLRVFGLIKSYIFVVPSLRENSVSIIRAVLARFSGVVTRSSAADERKTTVLLNKSIPDIGVRVRSAVRGCDVCFLQPFEGREALVVSDSCLEEVNDFLVLTVLRTVASNVECRVAGGVLGELVAPESSVILVLCNPVVVHVFE